jgi:hypothetical protein
MGAMRSLAHFEAPVLLLSILLTACGGRAINKNLAQQLIASLPQVALKNGDVDVESVTQMGKEAIVETRLQTAFRFEKINGNWVAREVRVGHGQWESISDIARTLEKAKVDETRKILEKIAAAIEKYLEKNGSLPAFKDYVALSDLLAPTYLNPLIRLDAWRRPLAAGRLGPNSIRLASAGPDGKFGTGDDIVVLAKASTNK